MSTLGALNTYSMMDPSKNGGHYTPVAGPARAGDVILCGDDGDFHHVVMNIGNGYVIDANSDGTPLAVTSLKNEPPDRSVWRPTGH